MTGRRLKPLLLGISIFLLVLTSLGRRALAAHDRGPAFDLLNRVWVVGRAVTREPWVALTFDDGPDLRFTPAVLRILREYHARATFFVVGRNVALWPGLVRRELAAGDEVENHTYSHPELFRLPQDDVNLEIAHCDKTLQEFVPIQTRFFRPPRERLSLAILRSARARGKQIVLAGVCLEHHEVHTPQAMADRVLTYARPGLIILAHDGRLDRHRTVEALPLLIDGLQARGYRLVTLRELLARDERRAAKEKVEPWGNFKAIP